MGLASSMIPAAISVLSNSCSSAVRALRGFVSCSVERFLMRGCLGLISSIMAEVCSEVCGCMVFIMRCMVGEMGLLGSATAGLPTRRLPAVTFSTLLPRVVCIQVQSWVSFFSGSGSPMVDSAGSSPRSRSFWSPDTSLLPANSARWFITNVSMGS